jgi:hydroxymethylpyrimidine/phosphomethylpyrimidine kinase
MSNELLPSNAEMPHAYPRVLTIAGSDSGGGAGIQADLKTFMAQGCYGMSAITALTAQNTRGVFGVHPVPAEFVAQQIDRVLEDIGADAVKTGMLFSSSIIAAVADALARHGVKTLVVDPVMVATSGDVLLQADARATMIAQLLPLALVVTPNVPEAEVLSGVKVVDDASLLEAAQRIHAMGPRYVLMKGGHLPGAEAVDVLYDGTLWRPYRAPRIDTVNTHGTGCTYAAAIAAHLARGLGVEDAVTAAKTYLTGALAHSTPLGGGHGPVNHLWHLG